MLESRRSGVLASVGDAQAAPVVSLGVTAVPGTAQQTFNLTLTAKADNVGVTSLVTDAAGSFSFTQVTPPYDIVVTNDNARTLFVGLSEASPKLAIDQFPQPYTHNYISGNCVGSYPANTVAAFAGECTQRRISAIAAAPVQI